jgi:hypothetical protein
MMDELFVIGIFSLLSSIAGAIMGLTTWQTIAIFLLGFVAGRIVGDIK